ncbi:MAG: hypothetical protein ACYTEX_11020 [Planctomycetota bacterium]|jgi:hypothetical protein
MAAEPEWTEETISKWGWCRRHERTVKRGYPCPECKYENEKAIRDAKRWVLGRSSTKTTEEG